MSEETELLAAQFAVVLASLDKLEAITTKVGGFMSHEDQQTLRDARVVLVEMGKRPRFDELTWVDRTCICKPVYGATSGRIVAHIRDPGCALHPQCTCVQLADGTNASRVGACVLHAPGLQCTGKP